MGNLVNTLKQLIREEMTSEAANQGRLSKGLVIANSEKAAKLKRLYPQDYWVVKIITTIEDATDKDITRLGYKDPSTGEFIDGLKQILDIKSERINSELRELIKSGIIVDKAESAIPKKEKPETTDKKGRKASDTSKAGIIRTLFQSWQDNAEYEPTESDVTYNIPKGLGTEKLSDKDTAKIKKSALGLSKRGQKASGEDPLLARINRELSEELLHETYRRLQKIK